MVTNCKKKNEKVIRKDGIYEILKHKSPLSIG